MSDQTPADKPGDDAPAPEGPVLDYAPPAARPEPRGVAGAALAFFAASFSTGALVMRLVNLFEGGRAANLCSASLAALAAAWGAALVAVVGTDRLRVTRAHRLRCASRPLWAALLAGAGHSVPAALAYVATRLFPDNDPVHVFATVGAIVVVLGLYPVAVGNWLFPWRV